MNLDFYLEAGIQTYLEASKKWSKSEVGCKLSSMPALTITLKREFYK